MANKPEVVANGILKYSERLAKELYLILREDFDDAAIAEVEDSDF